jgi:hypothetical protein
VFLAIFRSGFLAFPPNKFAERRNAPVETGLKLFAPHWPTAAIKEEQIGPSHLRVF